jgi:hypothetical protein
MLSTVPSAGPVNPPSSRRQSLEEWRAQLEKLIARRRLCPARQCNTSLATHLRSSIRGAFEEIAAACAPARGAVLSHAATVIAPFFRLPGDARRIAATFPAVAEFTGLLSGPVLANTLDDLTRQAEETITVIDRILEGREIWRFERERP